ncbi:ribosome biogenesis GTP-binding protein YihA/YsxC [Paraburkholderia denitrificans]|uniref:Probable GTP-binding protein EngB n=1 Tax=Paraburkholderia denitrificans TaxID=694025 RepID=A0ABW0JDT9_9BURK
MAFLLHQARFFTTVNHLRDLPATARPEIAFAGRSNAGKSTAINLLCNQKRLAFASKTPGRTQHINYFAVGPADAPTGYVVDLPGYGYAEVPEASKAHWEALLSQYLQSRAQLRGLILMMDARRPLTDLDCRMIEWFAPTGRPIHALLTKCDKLTRQESVLALRATKKAFDEYRQQGFEGELSAQLFSALKRVGLEEANTQIENWLVPPADQGDAGGAAESPVK